MTSPSAPEEDLTTERADASATAEPVDRIDPALSACVLIGVDDYDRLDPLRGVKVNLAELAAVMGDKNILGIPGDRIVRVPNPRIAYDLVEPIRKAAQLATDTLIVYYAGHGLINEDDGRLHLTLPSSIEEYPETCVPVDNVRTAIRKTGAARRRVLILDCCFSGRIIPSMSAGTRGRRGRDAAVATLQGVNGSYVMTSSPPDRPSYAPYPDKCTVFTGALVGVMREGIPRGPEMLGLADLFKAVKSRIAAMEPDLAQEPQSHDMNHVGRVEFIRNAALPRPEAAQVIVQQAPPRRRWLAASFVIGAALALTAAHVPGWWRDVAPTPAGGACNDRAALLDYSDALDKRQVGNEPIGGLSAISLLPGQPGKALVLADNSPGRVFPVDIGSPTDLRPVPSTAITLRRADGVAFNDWYDGESMIVEKPAAGAGKGRTTMVIGAETGPAIRRFDVTSGDQIGADFPIPKELHYPDRGGSAQEGRSIESLAASPDGHYLYAGWEAPLAQDGDNRGENVLRIQRYAGTPGGTYTLDGQFAYRSGDGLNLADLAAVDDDHLLALERQYVDGLGNAVQIAVLSLKGARDVTKTTTLYNLPADTYIQRSPLLNLADCPAGSPGVVPSRGVQSNPLLDNVEGMALGDVFTQGPHRGWRELLLVSDDNNSADQTTRLYSLAVDIPAS